MQDRLPLEKQIADYKPLYSEKAALHEANRCLFCYDPPCVKACPTNIDIPMFIRKISTGNIAGAAATILQSNILGYSCSRVCPVEVLCAGECVYNKTYEPPIQIGRLQRYATQSALQKQSLRRILGEPLLPTGKSVAFIGAGPASLTAAALLAMKGHKTVIYEQKNLAGGLNTFGIAPYKLHVEDSLFEISHLLDLGVIIKEKVTVNANIDDDHHVSAQSLLNNYDAIFLGMGIGEDARLPLTSASASNVFGATQLIAQIKTDTSLNLSCIKTAHIIGGGNTAIDVAHELRLLGVPEVVMLYRGPREKMSGYLHELQMAQKDDVRLIDNCVPISINCISNIAREIVVKVSEEQKILATDLIVFAIGQNKNMSVANAFHNVALTDKGLIFIDPTTYRTTHPSIWSAGDCVNGGKEVVNAVAEAKIAARSMHEFLMGMKNA